MFHSCHDDIVASKNVPFQSNFHCVNIQCFVSLIDPLQPKPFYDSMNVKDFVWYFLVKM